MAIKTKKILVPLDGSKNVTMIDNSSRVHDLLRKIGNHYGVVYGISTLFENSEIVFDEIVDRLKNLNRN